MKTYFLFENVKGNEPLVKRLNVVMGKLNLLRARTAPLSFEFNKDMAYWFYLTCVFERWCHELTYRLRVWKHITDVYLNEYDGNWKLYAKSRRFDVLRNGSGEEADYDGEGNIVERNLTDEELAKYSIIADMYDGREVDIIETTNCNNFEWLRVALQEDAKNITNDVETFADKDSEFYENFSKMSIDEKALQRAIAMANADDDIAFVVVLSYSISTICTTLEFLDKAQNNIEELRDINHKVGNILNHVFEE